MTYTTRAALLILMLSASQLLAKNAEVEFRVVDKDTGKAIAVRMHLRNMRGVARRARKAPFWHDHFVFHHRVIVSLPKGMYLFAIERGPEYKIVSGTLMIRGRETDNKTIEMERYVDMKKEGWWSGDLHVERSPRDMALLMLAEDLHVAPLIQWSNLRHRTKRRRIRKKKISAKMKKEGPLITVDENRYFQLQAGKDQSKGGVLLVYHTDPLHLHATSSEYPGSTGLLRLANKSAKSISVAEKPYWLDFPTWLANGRIDAVCLANDHLLRSGVTNHEAWGRKRSRDRFPAPHGNGRWSQKIYYRMLECGLQIPPAAGSGSGLAANPVGYNRVYVHCGPKLDYSKWWDGLRNGRVIVSNGPMLRPLVNGKLPGHVFSAEAGKTVELTPTLKLSIRDPVEYLEIVKNDEVVKRVRLSDYAKRRGMLPPVTFKRSGWMLIRAVSSHSKTYRFATTGPYYVKIGSTNRVSKHAAEFFANWVKKRITQLGKSRELRSKPRREEVLKPHRVALQFWRDLVNKATAP